MMPCCCDLLDEVAGFLIGDDPDGSGDGEEALIGDNPNNGIWETLSFQILLDLQQVHWFNNYLLSFFLTKLF